jgi:hypothetical protein
MNAATVVNRSMLKMDNRDSFPDFLRLNIRKWLIFSGDVRFQRVSDEFWGFMPHHTSTPTGFEYIKK